MCSQCSALSWRGSGRISTIQKEELLQAPLFSFFLLGCFGRPKNFLCPRHVFRNLVFVIIPNLDNPSNGHCVFHRRWDNDRIALTDFIPAAVIACSNHAINIDTAKSHFIVLSQNLVVRTRIESIPRLWSWKKSVSLPTKSAQLSGRPSLSNEPSRTDVSPLSRVMTIL